MTGVMLVNLIKRLRSDPAFVLLVLLVAPFFVILYKLIFLQGMTLYRIAVLESPGETAPVLRQIENEFLESMEARRYPGGGSLFEFYPVTSPAEGERLIQDHDVHCMLIFRPSENNSSAPGEVIILGDHSNPYYIIAAQLIENGIRNFLETADGSGPPLDIGELALGNSGGKTEFETYIPGLIIFSVLSLMYLFAILLMREVESNVFYRYRMAGLGRGSFVLGYSLMFLILSTLAVLLTLLTAYLLGFHSARSPLRDGILSMGVCAVLSMAGIGVAFLIAAFARSSLQALVLTTFPFMLLVFFSGSVYPFPKIPLLLIGNKAIGLFDILPSTHAVTALSKILTFGVPVSSLLYEFIALLLLSSTLFITGTSIFNARRMR